MQANYLVCQKPVFKANGLTQVSLGQAPGSGENPVFQR